MTLQAKQPSENGVRLTVERLGHLGDGIAEGVFIPMALPGEVVEGEVADGRITAPRIMTPSAERVSAPCPHYRACGGCSLMHARDGFVAEWKTGLARQALLAQGLDAPFRPTATSPATSRRRATFAGRRTRAGAIVGFHGRASDAITEIPGCLLLRPALVGALPALRDLTVIGTSRSAVLDLTVTETAEGLDVAVSNGKDPELSLRRDLASLAGTAGFARLTWNGEPMFTRAPPRITFGSARVPLPPGAFLQATAEGEAALASGVIEATTGAERIADLFAGTGTFALRLAAQAEVHAVEGDRSLTSALVAGWKSSPGLHSVTTETRDLFRRPLLPDELSRFDAVVLDPPRAGAEAQAKDLAISQVRRIAYVSCNPSTFARDVRILADAGFSIDWVQVVDQFRWSPHVELVACLTRA
jgi:23S rRNA (uracil1939-C5)-methyltransferase